MPHQRADLSFDDFHHIRDRWPTEKREAEDDEDEDEAEADADAEAEEVPPVGGLNPLRAFLYPPVRPGAAFGWSVVRAFGLDGAAVATVGAAAVAEGAVAAVAAAAAAAAAAAPVVAAVGAAVEADTAVVVEASGAGGGAVLPLWAAERGALKPPRRRRIVG